MKSEDLNYIARLEKAIEKKYGQEAVLNPKTAWDEKKEEEYLEQLKDGFFLPKNLINKKSKRKCLVCDIYSFNKKDDLYMNKFECCFSCYIQWVDGREERWKKGWRPDVKIKKEKV